MQKWKQSIWDLFSKKVPEKAVLTGSCQQCAYKYFAMNQSRYKEWKDKVICSYDKSVNMSTHTCNKFKEM